VNNRLHIGNLSFQTTADTLREALSRHGAVEDVHVPVERETGRARGFGFVTMVSAEDAQRAITALDGSTIDGRSVRVSIAQERSRN